MFSVIKKMFVSHLRQNVDTHIIACSTGTFYHIGPIYFEGFQMKFLGYGGGGSSYVAAENEKKKSLEFAGGSSSSIAAEDENKKLRETIKTLEQKLEDAIRISNENFDYLSEKNRELSEQNRVLIEQNQALSKQLTLFQLQSVTLQNSPALCFQFDEVQNSRSSNSIMPPTQDSAQLSENKGGMIFRSLKKSDRNMTA